MKTRTTMLWNVLVALVYLLGAGAAQAQTVLCGTDLETSNPCGEGDANAIGILNLEVVGASALYNVEFDFDVGADLFTLPLTFPIDLLALAATSAVSDALNTQPEVTTVGPQMSDFYDIPFGFDLGTGWSVRSAEYFPIAEGWQPLMDTGLVNASSFAVFTLAPVGAFNVSGAALASPGTATDSDVNDPNAPYAANDSDNESQPILAPGTVGGYLNSPGAGAAGRSMSSGDTVDTFRVSLAEGFTATLFIAEDDGATHDLDLLLFDVADPETLVDSSMGTGIKEQVTAPLAGDYYIVVGVAENATDAASSYLLILGRDPSAAQSFSLRLEDDFAPGQAIVHFDDDDSGAVAGATARTSLLQNRASTLGLEHMAGAAGRPMLFELGQDEARTSALGATGSGAARAGLDAWLPTDPETREKLETLRLIKQLRRRADVVAADPNYRRFATATPNDERYPEQWHYTQILLPQAWDITTGSSDTVVAVIDTGVLRNHPDLQGPLLTGPGSGYDFIRDPNISDDGGGIDPDWNDNGDGDGGLSSFHGTHVSGTIAAATNNGTGVAGVNWNARIMPLRVLGIGGGYSYDIQQAVRYAAGLDNDSNTVPPRKADIMNLSLGGFGSSQTEQETYLEARAEGVIIVAAAGNNESSIRSYPAAYDGVVSVSAVNLLKQPASYSNFGATIDVAAPGGATSQDWDGDGHADGVLSTLGEDLGPGINFGYARYQGTSMASPHVAGVASLMRAIDPALSPAQFDLLLANGDLTDDLGDPGRDDEYGYGLINAQKAVLAAGGEPPTAAELVVNPNSLNFSVDGDSAILDVSNVGGGTLTIEEFSEDSAGGWLTVSVLNVDGSGLGTYTASVDRSGLPDGLYEATVSFVSLEAGTVDVPVLMAKSGIATGDAGYQYVRLVDAETRATTAQVGVAVANGRYDFSFANVSPGTYFLGAGSNTDNDSLICEVGESCGGYPVLSQLSPITVVDQDISGLEFVTRYLIRVPEPSSAVLGLVALATLASLARRRRR